MEAAVVEDGEQPLPQAPEDLRDNAVGIHRDVDHRTRVFLPELVDESGRLGE